MKKTVLMTHIVAGYPTMEESEKIAISMAKSGVSFIEIQIPFSDPIADGATIMAANTKALKNGITPADCFALMKRLKRKIKIPLIFMTYFNIPFNYGLEKFCAHARESGCYGLIIPDIPIDEERHEHYIKLCKKYKMHPIQVISPITPDVRLKKIAEKASGFVYCVSRHGTTGERKELSRGLDKYLKKVRKFIKIPLALGFGISNKMQVKMAAQKADIVVIGSAILNLYDAAPKDKKIESVKSFIENSLRP